jgi:hypothetical protein
MKKQFQILATTFISIAIVSCSKQSIEMPGAAAIKPSEEISMSANRPYIDPLTVNLEASFQFDGNLKDQTKKLSDGISYCPPCNIYTGQKRQFEKCDLPR